MNETMEMRVLRPVASISTSTSGRSQDGLARKKNGRTTVAGPSEPTNGATESTELLQKFRRGQREEGSSKSWIFVKERKTVIVAVLVFAVMLALVIRERVQGSDSRSSRIMPMTSVAMVGLAPGGGSTNKTRRQPQALELAQFKLVITCTNGDFVDRAQALKAFFSSTGNALQRSLVWNPATGEWSDIVFWATMSSALQAAEDIVVSPAAQPFLQCINTTTLRLSHAYIEMDTSWNLLLPKQPGVVNNNAVVEIAAFPLTTGVSDKEFVKDAIATTPFFTKLRTARRRILAQQRDSSIAAVRGDVVWYDLVFWVSMEAAIEAAKAIEHVPAARPFLNAINSTDTNIFSFTYSQLMLGQEFWRGVA